MKRAELEALAEAIAKSKVKRELPLQPVNCEVYFKEGYREGFAKLRGNNGSVE